MSRGIVIGEGYLLRAPGDLIDVGGNQLAIEAEGVASGAGRQSFPLDLQLFFHSDDMLAENLLEGAALGLHAGGCGTEVKISVYQVVDRGEGKPSFFRKSSVIGNDGEKDGHSICIFLQAGRRMG